MRKLNVLSLFDGMSCARIALDKLNIPVNYYACEIDKYAIEVAKKNYPDTIHLGSVTDVSWVDDKTPSKITPDKLNICAKIDLLIGGSPCQGFSFAGKGLNFDDPRSKLFFEYVRILKECKPKYFLLENVRMSKDSEQIITDILGVEPIAINSNLVSGQNRYRLYWTNIPFEVPKDKKVVLQDILENGVVDRDKSHCLDANYWKGGNLKSYFEKNRRQLVFNAYPHDIKDKGLTWRKLKPVECERLQTVPDNYTDCVSNTQRYKMLGNGFTVDIIAHILKGVNYE